MDDDNDKINENSNLEEWTLQLDKIVKSKEHLTVTRLLAASLQNNPYMTVGEFFKGISDWDLEMLLELGEKIFDDEEEFDNTEDLLLLTMMLCNAEGSPSTNMEELQDRLGIFNVLIAGTSLARKGLCRAYYENMSFHEDSRDLKVFEKI